MKIKKYFLSYLILFIAIAFIIYGIITNEMMPVFNKAIYICLECIGIG